MSEISTLFPGKEVILNSGEVIKIEPFKFGQIPLALKLTNKIGSLLGEMYKSGELTNRDKTVANVVYILSEGGEELIHLVGLGIGKNRGWFDTLDSDDGVKLVIAFLEVNVDFFTKKMMPQLLAAMQQMKDIKPT